MEGRIRGRKRKLARAEAWTRLRALAGRMMDGLRRVWAGAGGAMSSVMPPREVLVVTAVAGLAFGLGLAFGRATAPPGSLRNFVTIERIGIQETGASPSDGSARTDSKAEVGGILEPGEDATPSVERPSRTAERAAGSENVADPAGREGGVGVVGPVPDADASARVSSPPRPLPDAPASSPSPGPARRPPTPEAASPLREEKMLMPVQGRTISEFGWTRHPVFADWRYHTGIDVGVADGTPVKAALSGKVLEVGTKRELGLYVLAEHRVGLCTKYGHLGSSSVSPGDEIVQGESIGKTGSSGVTSGSYLHFEVIRAGKVQNPRDFL